MDKERNARRLCALYRGIAAACAPMYRLRCVGRCDAGRDYVITLRKCSSRPPLERLAALYRYLQRQVLPGEQLTLAGDCFVLTGPEYRWTYTVEWYKHAQFGLSTADGRVGAELLRRMGVERSVRRYGYRRRAGYPPVTLCTRYPNPAARFTAWVQSQGRRCAWTQGT